MAQDILFEREDGIGLITLNRPERNNALTRQHWLELAGVFEQAERDNSVKVVVVTGAGEAFCAGADVSVLAADQSIGSSAVERSVVALTVVRSISLMNKPLIASVNGVAAGGGFSLALLCDIRYASDTSRFVASFVRRALAPDLGITFLLPRLVGSNKALEILLTGDSLSVDEAEKLGIVNKVVPRDQLMAQTMELAQKIAKGPSISINLIKSAVYAGLRNNLDDQVKLESLNQTICMNSEDFHEGVLAFKEKRPPVFRGR